MEKEEKRRGRGRGRGRNEGLLYIRGWKKTSRACKASAADGERAAEGGGEATGQVYLIMLKILLG